MDFQLGVMCIHEDYGRTFSCVLLLCPFQAFPRLLHVTKLRLNTLLEIHLQVSDCHILPIFEEYLFNLNDPGRYFELKHTAWLKFISYGLVLISSRLFHKIIIPILILFYFCLEWSSRLVSPVILPKYLLV